MKYVIDCSKLSKDEQEQQDLSIENVLDNSPFILSINKIEKYKLDVDKLKPYFVNKFFDDDLNYPNMPDNEIIPNMPFNILLNRIDVNDELYERVCFYVYGRVRKNDYDLKYFIDMMVKYDRIIPIEIIYDLARLNKATFYCKAKAFDEKIRNKRYVKTISENNKTKRIFKNSDRNDFDDSGIYYMIGKIISHTPLFIDIDVLEKKGILEETPLHSWFYENFWRHDIAFSIVYDRLYNEEKYDDLNRIIKIVETNIVNSESVIYNSIYIAEALALDFSEKNVEILKYIKKAHIELPNEIRLVEV